MEDKIDILKTNSLVLLLTLTMLIMACGEVKGSFDEERGKTNPTSSSSADEESSSSSVVEKSSSSSAVVEKSSSSSAVGKSSSSSAVGKSSSSSVVEKSSSSSEVEEPSSSSEVVKPSSSSAEDNIANYETVQIGDQVWMAKNLNREVSGSKCYENEPANCETYGMLYDWAAAMKACPSGSHLPSETEWQLAEFGSDFVAKLGGLGKINNGGFSNIDKNGYWWSATEADSQFSKYINDKRTIAEGDKGLLLSVRCIKN